MASVPLLRLAVVPPSPKTLTAKPLFLRHTPFRQQSLPRLTPRRKPPIVTLASYSPTPAADQLIAAAAYCLPFFNGLQYGRYAFVQYLALEHVFEPLLPVVSAYRSVPFASFAAFFALYLLLVRNPNFGRFIRFNAMQAVVMDVLLVLSLLVQRVFTPGRGIGFKILIVGYNCMFALLVGCFLYCLASCVLGRTPYLPFVAEAADRQL
ncbi:protein TIC 20-II, chloroplastic-like [Nymphaea colorata]